MYKIFKALLLLWTVPIVFGSLKESLPTIQSLSAIRRKGRKFPNRWAATQKSNNSKRLLTFQENKFSV
jgi:hypothetical protein